jgi:hypothetical protein
LSAGRRFCLKKRGEGDLRLSNLFVYLYNILFIENMAHTDIHIDRIPVHAGARPLHVGWRICIYLLILHLLAIPEALVI